MKPSHTSPRLKGVLYALCWLPFLLASPSKLLAGVSIDIEGIKDTVNIEHIKAGYYSIKALNPTGIVPVGPANDFS